MSLFASLGQGDVWSLSGISFASPINDILDRGGYTLEELLVEDELIQEVKSKNERLIDFLCTDENLKKLIDYIVLPPQATDSDERVHRYPYMSCEVICCEVPCLLSRLADDRSPALLDHLMSLLDQEGELSCHLAGYFEKILEMLFRKMTGPMMTYFNNAGMTLLQSFVRHIHNYSIMQIIQRLMLPHIPFNNENAAAAGEGEGESDYAEPFCGWSFDSQTCHQLLQCMLQCRHTDIPLHVSDLVITVLQLSPPETLLVKYLCQDDVMDALMAQAVKFQNLKGLDMLNPETSGDVDKNPGAQRLLEYNISLASTAVMESLISRLYEAEYSMQEMMESSGANSADNTLVQGYIEVICTKMLQYILPLKEVLAQQQQHNTSALGHHGLQIIKLTEAIVRLGNDKIEEELCTHEVFSLIIYYYFLYENNSILHLSVQRIVVMLLEAAEARSVTQMFVLTHCDLLRIIMQKINACYPSKLFVMRAVASSDSLENHGSDAEDSAMDKESAEVGDVAVSTEVESIKTASVGASGTDLAALSADTQDGRVSLLQQVLLLVSKGTSRHSSSMGNLMLIGQGACVALENVDADERQQHQQQHKDDKAEQPEFGQFNSLSPSFEGAGSSHDDMPHGYLRTKFVNEPSLQSLLSEWDGFVQQRLKPLIEHNFNGSGQAQSSPDDHVVEVRVVRQEEGGEVQFEDAFTHSDHEYDEDHFAEGSDPFQKTQTLNPQIYQHYNGGSESDSSSDEDEEENIFNSQFHDDTQHREPHHHRLHHSEPTDFADFDAFGSPDAANTLTLEDVNFAWALSNDSSTLLPPALVEEVQGLSDSIVVTDVFGDKQPDVDFGASRADDW